jgi:ribonuclease HII
MRRAVLSMSCPPHRLLVDGNRLPQLGGLGGVEARAIVGGDATEPSISAASILAKTARDYYMNQMDTIYPEYDFASHKGYGTVTHRRLLAAHGPCPLHRRTFGPVARALGRAGECDAAAELDDCDDDFQGADLAVDSASSFVRLSES